MKENITLGASVLAAIAASLCCIGPLAVVVLGLGSFGAAAAFEAWRPYLLGLTFALLVAAFYLTYRKREVACVDGSCHVSRAPRWNKTLLWLVASVVILVTAFPYYSGALVAALYRDGGQAASSPRTEATTKPALTDLESFEPLRLRFQSDQGKIRVIALLSPT
jgi:mercuric ion transport protein